MTTAIAEPTANRNLTRRQFLAVGWTVAGLVAAGETGGALLSFMYPRLQAGAFGGVVSIGSPAEIAASLLAPSAGPNESFKQSGRFYLTRTDDGILALYRKCVHLGCVVPWNAEEDIFHCACHGSKYNRKGEVISGPAPRPLDYFLIRNESGVLVVDTGTPLRRTHYDPSQSLLFA